MRQWMVAGLFLAWTPLGAATGWDSVEKALGRPGVAQGDGFRVLFSRTDLNEVVQGYPLDSANMLASQFTFIPGPEGSSKKTTLEGRVFLLDSEVSKAMAQAAKNGLETIALYSPFLDESPCLKCLRLRGEGARSNLAWAAKMVLSATGTPMDLPTKKETPEATAISSPSSHPNDWGQVQDLLGTGDEKGSTLLYQWEASDRSASIAFQNHGKNTTALGEFAVPEGESKALVENFLQRHITVTAVADGDRGESRRSFVDFWAVGDKKKLAEDIKEILNQEELLNP